MNNARVTIDGSQVSMASIIAMASDQLKDQKDAFFVISEDYALHIDTEFGQQYPATKNARYRIAQKSESAFIGVFNQVPIYYSRTPNQ